MAQLNQPVLMGYSTGKTCWFMSFRQSDLYVLNKNTKAWVPFVLADLADYFMTYTEIASTGLYVGYYPTDFLLDVLPLEVSYQQAGPTPALPDDLPMITPGQSQGSSIAAIQYSVSAANRLGVSANTMRTGTVEAGTNNTTQATTDLGGTDNIYRGRVVLFTSGDATPSAGIITGFVASTGVLTFTALPTAPSPGDTLIIV